MIIHVVQWGETLWSISQRYGANMQQLINMNQLPNPNQLAIGQALLIPNPFLQYVVQPGDTLWNIAQRFNVSFQELTQINRITNASLIYPGQVLNIPVSYHTVKPGETIWIISQRYNTSIQAILQANPGLNPNMIYPGQQIKIPVASKPTIEVNAYTIQFGEPGAQTVREVGEYLTYMMPFGYRIQSDATLTPMNDQPLIQAAISENIVPVMAITNFSSTETGSNLAHTILSNAALQEKLLDNIVILMKNKGYQGLNIDFENVLSQDREFYNQFLRLSAEKMHENRFFVSSALAPKTSAEQKGLLYEAHDYAAHGRFMDFVVLMTYEWGYRMGPPQAISPLNQIKRVLDYAVAVIPRNKIFMGFQLYARDWKIPHVSGTEAETFDMQEAVRRAIRYGAQIKYGTSAQSPYYRYTDENQQEHEVWFEDARSAQAKFDTVKEYRLRGISYWVLGYPFPQNWVLLVNNCNIQKL